MDAGPEDKSPRERQRKDMQTGLAPPAPTVHSLFVDAVLALADDPSARNVARYLAASRELEQARRGEADSALPGAVPARKET